MRWDALFDDLSAQADASEARDRVLEARDRARIEVGAVTMIDRVRSSTGAMIRLRCVDGVAVSGVLARTGANWLLVHETNAGEVVVRAEAVSSVVGATRYVNAPGDVVHARLDVRHVLRGIARDRSGVTIRLFDGSAISGTIDRVGADFVDLAVHATGESRRSRDVVETAVVSIAAIVAVRRGS